MGLAEDYQIIKASKAEYDRFIVIKQHEREWQDVDGETYRLKDL
jgi:hypothetical protein